MMSVLPPQVPWRRFVGVLRKLGYTPQKGKAGSVRSFVHPSHSPHIVSFRHPHPGQNMRQRMLHEYLRKLLLAPDEFMHLLEDCEIGRANDSSWPSGSGMWKYRSPQKASCGLSG